jgi:dTMP kinase
MQIPEKRMKSNGWGTTKINVCLIKGENEVKYPGRLIVVEGTDGSGKSTQIYLLKKWLEAENYPVFFTEWNSSELIKHWTKRAKKNKMLTSLTFSLIHASDFFDRYEKFILPRLRTGYIVLADRYIYTAYARDIARGCDPAWVRNTYKSAVRPSLALYFRTPLDIAVHRILSGRPELKYHEAGMDLGVSNDPVESFKIYQGLIKDQYDAMIESEGLTVIDATQSITEQQAAVRQLVAQTLKDYEPPIYVEKFRKDAAGSWRNLR